VLKMAGEVLSGPERRRRWSSEQKASIVSETAQPGTSVSEVARRHGISRSLVYSWRREAMARNGIAPEVPEFVPVVIAGPGSEPAARDERRKAATGAAGTIEIALPGAVHVRVCGKVEERTLQAVLAALRSA
jgi:transposase